MTCEPICVVLIKTLIRQQSIYLFTYKFPQLLHKPLKAQIKKFKYLQDICLITALTDRLCLLRRRIDNHIFLLIKCASCLLSLDCEHRLCKINVHKSLTDITIAIKHLKYHD